METKRYGRWAIGDIAEDKSTGKFYKVIGFVTDPAVCFQEIGGENHFTVVAGCRNDLSDLIHYKKAMEAHIGGHYETE